LGITQVWRPPSARVVTGAWAFDLNHISTHIGEILGAKGTRQNTGQIENPHAV
jgi:hypothetical protein